MRSSMSSLSGHHDVQRHAVGITGPTVLVIENENGLVGSKRVSIGTGPPDDDCMFFAGIGCSDITGDHVLFCGIAAVEITRQGPRALHFAGDGCVQFLLPGDGHLVLLWTNAAAVELQRSGTNAQDLRVVVPSPSCRRWFGRFSRSAWRCRDRPGTTAKQQVSEPRHELGKECRDTHRNGL